MEKDAEFERFKGIMDNWVAEDENKKMKDKEIKMERVEKTTYIDTKLQDYMKAEELKKKYNDIAEKKKEELKRNHPIYKAHEELSEGVKNLEQDMKNQDLGYKYLKKRIGELHIQLSGFQTLSIFNLIGLICLFFFVVYKIYAV